VNPGFPTTSIDPSTNLGTATPFAVDQIIAGMQPETLPVPAIPEGSAGDIPVEVGQQYVVFLAIDLTGEQGTECVVGGARGLFHYNSATQTVTRVSTRPSQIPTTLSLAQFMSQIPNPNVPVPTKVPTPSVCSPSVTGG